MVSVALFVRLEAKAGKEKEVEDFLRGGFPIGTGRAGHDRMVWAPPWADDVRHL